MSGSIRIIDMPDLGVVDDTSSVVGERAGSGRFQASALKSYVLGASAGSGGDTGRNLIHNPLFSIAQRGTGPWTTNGYTLDRWQLALFNDTASVIQGPLSDADRAAIGDEAAEFYIQSTFTGSSAGGSFNALSHKIEDTKRLSGKTVTLSYWAKAASGTPVVGTTWQQNFGSGGSTQLQGSYSLQTISTSWARYSATFTLPSVAGKTTGTGDNTAIVFAFSAQGVFVQSGVIALWGVQLEVGSVATSLVKLDPADDLRLCKRFYQTGYLYGAINVAGTPNYAVAVLLPVAMRATPTLAVINNTSTNLSGLSLTAQGSLGVIGQGTITTGGAQTYLNTQFTASADL